MEDIMNGVQTCRNPKLVHILDKLSVIENYGTGIPRILNAYKKSEKQPAFSSTEYFFTVRLPNLNYNDPINDPIKKQDESYFTDEDFINCKVGEWISKP